MLSVVFAQHGPAGPARDARLDLAEAGCDVLQAEIPQNRKMYADIWGTVPTAWARTRRSQAPQPVPPPARRPRVRWAVTGREHCKSFAAKPLADGFLTGLKDAACDHQPFDEATGMPAVPSRTSAQPRSWYDHARSYEEMKWPHLAPKITPVHRRGTDHRAPALAARRRGAPDPDILNRALFGWAFNPGIRNLTPPAPIAAAPAWAADASQTVAVLDDPDILRAVLGACAQPGPARPRRLPPSGASDRCCTTRSATPSSSAC